VTSSGSYRGKGNYTASCEVCRHLSPGPLFQIASRGTKPETRGLSLVRQILQRYRLTTTSKQFMAMIPENFDEGDILRVLYGSKFPHEMRKVPGKEDTCTLIGSALMKIWGGSRVSYEPTRESLCF
jgi:hypothetical protein